MSEKELKTLKDLDKYTLESDDYPGGSGGYLRDVDKWNKEDNYDDNDILFTKADLRAEAVKWVKREQKNLPFSWFDYSQMMIKFFNLTEEELK